MSGNLEDKARAIQGDTARHFADRNGNPDTYRGIAKGLYTNEGPRKDSGDTPHEFLEAMHDMEQDEGLIVAGTTDELEEIVTLNPEKAREYL